MTGAAMYAGAMPRRRKDAPEPEERVDTHIYLPRSVYDAVARAAQENDRSINAEVLQALRRWLRSHDTDASFALAS